MSEGASEAASDASRLQSDRGRDHFRRAKRFRRLKRFLKMAPTQGLAELLVWRVAAAAGVALAVHVLIFALLVVSVRSSDAMVTSALESGDALHWSAVVLTDMRLLQDTAGGGQWAVEGEDVAAVKGELLAATEVRNVGTQAGKGQQVAERGPCDRQLMGCGWWRHCGYHCLCGSDELVLPEQRLLCETVCAAAAPPGHQQLSRDALRAQVFEDRYEAQYIGNQQQGRAIAPRDRVFEEPELPVVVFQDTTPPSSISKTVSLLELAEEVAQKALLVHDMTDAQLADSESNRHWLFVFTNTKEPLLPALDAVLKATSDEVLGSLEDLQTDMVIIAVLQSILVVPLVALVVWVQLRVSRPSGRRSKSPFPSLSWKPSSPLVLTDGGMPCGSRGCT